MEQFRLGDLSVNRMGYGAMQLAGRPGVWGPPRDRAAAVAVLREAVALGVNHIDTSDYYGPHVVNEVIREALHPYPADLVIVTKVGYRRGEDRSWIPDASADALTAAVHDNLRRLSLDVLDVVNLRLSSPADDVEGPFETLADLRRQGLIRHLGISNVRAEQVRRAHACAGIACVQNEYNLAHRRDDALIDELAGQGIAYASFSPLGGFSRLQSAVLDRVAAELGVSPLQAALAWLLHRSPNILPIPGTSSMAHLRENLAAADIALSAQALAYLDAVAA